MTKLCYETFVRFFFAHPLIFRHACAITDQASNSVIITGGTDTLRTVSRYGTAGHLEDLPSLNQGRAGHGCGAYTGDNGEQVIVITYSIMF